MSKPTTLKDLDNEIKRLTVSNKNLRSVIVQREQHVDEMSVEMQNLHHQINAANGRAMAQREAYERTFAILLRISSEGQ